MVFADFQIFLYQLIIMRAVIIQFIMLTQNKRKVPYVIVLVLIIALTILHYALAGTADRYYQSKGVQYQQKISDSSVAFIVVLATLNFIIAVILLIDVFCNILKNKKLRHILITVLLVFEFSLACIAAFLATVAQRQKGLYDDFNLARPEKLDQFYGVAIADAILTFVLKLTLLVVSFYYSLDDIAYSPPSFNDPAPGVPGSATRF